MKQFFFVKIGEFTHEHEFIRPVGRLIQIPLTVKTTNAWVYSQLGDDLWLDEQDAYEQYMNAVGDFKARQSFMQSQFFTPEEGVKLYAIFEVRDVNG